MTQSNTVQELQSTQWKFVVHEHPDTDALLCLWLLMSHYVREADTADVTFVRAGESLPESAATGYTVIHADTGGGDFDQHGKSLGRTSSFEIMATKFGYQNRIDIKRLIKLANDADSGDGQCDPTSIHFLFRALPFYYYDQQKRQTDWLDVVNHALKSVDALSGMWLSHADGDTKYLKHGHDKKKRLKNGLTVCTLVDRPNLRDAAFRDGVDVVCWTIPVKGGCYVGIQVSSNIKEISLKLVVEALRKAEADKRKVVGLPNNLGSIGHVEGIPGWFLHDSLRFVGCGTRSHPLYGEEVTKLKPSEITDIFIQAMSEIKL